jgi:hydrogenase nickel incorporation protein HypA/HybF
MHELSIVQALLDQVENIRRANGCGRVAAVTVRVGKWRQVVPDVFRFYYEILTAEGQLAGSSLELEQVDATARCHACGITFTVDDAYIVCPACSALGATMLTGTELDLISIELED